VNHKWLENNQDIQGQGFGFDPRWLLLIASVVGLLWRGAILSQDLTSILAIYGSDDLFYFTQIAHFWHHSGLPSIDGLSVTTGFQPLFTALLLPFQGFTGDPLLALRVNLGLVSLITLGTAWSMPGMMTPWLGVRRGQWAGTVLGCLWLLHPRLLEVTFHGTEAALAMLCWVWSVRVWARMKSSPKAAFGFGLVLGLGCLARIDQLALAVLLILWPRAGWRWFARAWCLLGLTLMLAPWVIYSMMLTGSPFQDSGRAKRLQYRHIQAQQLESHSPGGETHGLIELAKAKTRQLARVPQPLWRTRGDVSRVSLLGWIAGGFWLLWLAWMNPARGLALWGDVSKFLPPIVAAFAIIGAYWWAFGALRAWYYMPLHWALGLAAALAWVHLIEPEKRLGRALALSGVVFIWMTLLVAEAAPREPFRWEPIYHRAALVLQAKTPPNARIGAFNAGIQAATAVHSRKVVNLDGVVNHEALDALAAGELSDYLDRKDIGYLIDHRGAIGFYESLGGRGLSERLRLVARFPVEARPDQEICLWQVMTRSDRDNAD